MDKITAVYIRVSTQDQRVDSQQHELKRTCKQRGWTKTEYYTDKISGAKTSRPELDRLGRGMPAGKIESLVCYKVDRVGRSVPHLALFLDASKWRTRRLICETA